MVRRTLQSILVVAAILSFSTACGQGAAKGSPWQEKFEISSCKLLTAGRNQYFVLEPGFQLVLEGGGLRLQITVLDETKTVDGVATRVVEEKEWKDGKLFEIARNYFAMCEQTKDVFYFGEDVNFYENYYSTSDRNYSRYKNPEVDKLIDQQSAEADKDKRKKLVWEIEKKLADDAARPILNYNVANTCWTPQLKGLLLQVNSIYNGWRFEDVWLDR